MGYIFEQEIEAIKNTVRAKTIGEDDSISLKQVLVSSIHPALKAYFRSEVERLLKSERGQEHRSKRFPYSHPSVMSLQRQIDLLLIQNYSFEQSEFEARVDEAVHFQFNYLCRPQWTLLNFIVGNNRTVSITTIENKLEYCTDYEYLPSLIKRYLIDKGLTEVSYEEFKALLAKIDNEIVAQHSSFELAKMTRALFAFVDAGKVLPHNQFDQPTIPINAAVVFFEDKQLDAIKSRIEYERDVNKVQQLSVAELAALIEKARTRNEEAGIPVISFALPDEPTEPVVPVEEPKPVLRTELPKTETVVVIKKPIIFEDEPLGEPEPVPEQSEEPVVRISHEQILKDVRDLFSSSDRKRFIKSIFHKEAEAFESALSEVNMIDAWAEASHFLDALFVSQDVDPFSKEAVEFTDRIYARYFTK